LGNAVEELAFEGQILVRNEDGNPDVLFYNEAKYNTPMDRGMNSQNIKPILFFFFFFFFYVLFRIQENVVGNQCP
jgi:hypothetical protein